MLSKKHSAAKLRKLQLAVDAVRAERRESRADGALDRVLASPRKHRWPMADGEAHDAARRAEGGGHQAKSDRRMILTPVEETLIVQYCPPERGRAGALARRDPRDDVAVLKRRQAINTRDGTHCPLSKPALHLLHSGTVTRHCWQRFFARAPGAQGRRRVADL